MENEQAEPTSETSPDQENVNEKSSASSEDVEEAFISRGKGTSSDRVTFLKARPLRKGDVGWYH